VVLPEDLERDRTDPKESDDRCSKVSGMKPLRIALAPLCAALALACTHLPPPQSSWDHEANFANLKSFDWYADPAEDKTIGSAVVDTRFVDDHVKKDATATLQKKGYSPAAGGAADFYLDYHTRAAGVISRDKYGAYAWWGMPVYMGSQNYKEVILAIDVRDRDKKLIWRGWLTKIAGSSPEAIARQIEKAVDQILAMFPPGAPGKS
jgi:Domain of unknown function (DUF4136)